MGRGLEPPEFAGELDFIGAWSYHRCGDARDGGGERRAGPGGSPRSSSDRGLGARTGVRCADRAARWDDHGTYA